MHNYAQGYVEKSVTEPQGVKRSIAALIFSTAIVTGRSFYNSLDTKAFSGISTFPQVLLLVLVLNHV